MTARIAYSGHGSPTVSVEALFKSGKDTVQIAELLGISEAVASRRLFIARCKRLKLAIGFEPRDARRPGRPRKAVAA